MRRFSALPVPIQYPMPLLKIAVYPEEEKILRARARPVLKVTRNLQRMMDDMIETMREAAGVGLAAPQVYVNQRFFVYEWDDEPDALINPEVLEVHGESNEEEGCLSLPRLQGKVIRPSEVLVSGLDRRGRRVRLHAREYLARVLLHEIDHLNGVLFIDRAQRDTLHWLTEEEEAERVRSAHKATAERAAEKVKDLASGEGR